MFDFAPASATFTPVPTARETDPEYVELPPPDVESVSVTGILPSVELLPVTDIVPKPAKSRPLTSRVPFLTDTIHAVADDGAVWVHFASLCTNLGLAYHSQYVKMRRCPGVETRNITVRLDAGRRPANYVFLSGRGMLAWLMSIRPSRVKPELRDKIERYQTEALDVLERHFFGTTRPTPAVVEPARVPSVPNGFVDVRESAGDIVTDMLNAMLAARRSQLETERRLAGAETDIRGIAARIADVEGAVGDVDRRLSNVEATPVPLQAAPEPWFTVGEYLRRTKRELPEREKIQAGGQLHDKMADLGVSIRRKVSNSGYWQNTYPLPVLKEHFGD